MYIMLVERDSKTKEYIYLRTEEISEEKEVREQYEKLLKEGVDVFIMRSAKRPDDPAFTQSGRKERRRIQRRMRPIITRMQKKQEREEQRQAVVDEFIEQEVELAAERGVTILPSMKKILGGS